MARTFSIVALGGAVLLTAPGCASTMSSLGADTVVKQGCLIGTGTGAALGAVAGNQLSDNRTQGALIGAGVGAVLGYMAGCNYGKMIEERRAGFENDAAFHENQIQLAEAKASELETANTNLEQEISATNTVIANLESDTLTQEKRVEMAEKALSTNKAALAEYRKSSAEIEQEIELQETLVAQIREDDADSEAAARLETQIASLKAENAKMVAQIDVMTAQSEQIGGFL